MKNFIFSFLCVILFANQTIAQQRNISGTVRAFKDLTLKNITVTAAKAKTTTTTDSLGRFRLVCEPTDKLEFTGAGFNKMVYKLESQEKLIKVKMIFKGGNKNIVLAVENKHVTKEKLENSIQLYAEQNYEYYNYPDVLDAISRIYAGNDDISVRGHQVFVRNNSSSSAYPAIWIVNGKLALDVSNIMTRDIDSIEIIPDGSSKYGAGAANGVVMITTLDKR
jgi:TonB-dependent SusC/RagA subfamily outer membrane receptor